MCRKIWGHRTEISNYYALCSSLFVDILGFICPGIGNAGVFTLVSSWVQRSCLRVVSRYYHFSRSWTEQVCSSYNASDLHSRGALLESLTVLCFHVGFPRLREAAVVLPQIIPRSLRSTFCPNYYSLVIRCCIVWITNSIVNGQINNKLTVRVIWLIATPVRVDRLSVIQMGVTLAY